MPKYFEQQGELHDRHHSEHYLNLTLTARDNSCYLCYPPPPKQRLSESFWNFWTWLLSDFSAATYSAYTVTAFEAFLRLLRDHPPNATIISNQLSNLAYRTLLSVHYVKPLPEPHLLYYFINLPAITNWFSNPVTPEILHAVTTTIDPFLENMEGLNNGDNNNAPPADGDITPAQLQNVLNAVLGADGLNIPRLLNRDRTPRELSLVKVDSFKGTEAEDPYEWMESLITLQGPTIGLPPAALRSFPDSSRTPLKIGITPIRT